MKKILSILFFISLLIGCNNANGTHCAEVKYYNPKTGTRSVYTLKVEVKKNKLAVIYWPSGGWLDDSHFIPPKISNGIARFRSDKGVEYEVTIVDEEDCTNRKLK